MHRNIYLFLLLIATVACRPTKESVTRYQFFEKNQKALDSIKIVLKEPIIQKSDLLSLNISSATLNQEQAAVFNLGAAGQQGGGSGGQVFGNLVDTDGNISIPIIGKVQAAGLTKQQLEKSLLDKLEPYVKNPVVSIRFLNFRVMMMGESNTKGWINFQNEKATIVDAIGMAGITENGLRENVLLIRQQADGSVQTHRLDLNDAMIFKSPYFQLQQNDIIYIQPNESKILQYERANSPFFRDLPVYMGLITSVLAFVTLIVSATK